jgi:hypothetical protein
MSIKSITLTAAIIGVGLALPGAALGVPIDGPQGPAYRVQNQGDAEQTATLPFGDAVITANAQRDAEQTATLPFGDAEITASLDGLASRTQTELAQRSPATPPPVAAASDSGFEWGDAGIGAASMLALAGIAVGGYVLLRNRGRGPELRPSGS